MWVIGFLRAGKHKTGGLGLICGGENFCLSSHPPASTLGGGGLQTPFRSRVSAGGTIFCRIGHRKSEGQPHLESRGLRNVPDPPPGREYQLLPKPSGVVVRVNRESPTEKRALDTERIQPFSNKDGAPTTERTASLNKKGEHTEGNKGDRCRRYRSVKEEQRGRAELAVSYGKERGEKNPEDPEL